MSSLAIIFLNAAPDMWAIANVIVEVFASIYIRGYWKAKAEIPFMTEYNEAIRKSNDLRRLLSALGVGWAITGAVGYLTSGN